MKKKILGIVISLFSMAIVFGLVAYGTLTYIRNKNVEETGNLLGVSWYNEQDPEFTITTKEELYEFAKLSDYYSFDGQTVRLGADIVINEGNAEDWVKNAPKTRWTPIKNFAGTFDGQGHTISGLYAKAYQTPMALFIHTEYTSTIKDVSLVNSLFKTGGNGGVASFLSNGGGELKKLYSDAIFVHDGEKVGGIASDVTAQSIIENCWFEGSIEATSRNVGGIVDVVTKGARVTIKHCLFSGDIEQKYDWNGTRTAGIVGRITGNSTVIISDTLSCGTMRTAIESEIGALIGKSEAGSNVTVTDSYTSKATHSAVVGNKGAAQTGDAIGIYGQYLIGTKAYQWTSLDFESFWVAVEDETPILKCFAKDVTPLSLVGVPKEFDTSWFSESSSNMVITTRQQLYGFAYLSMSNTFTGQTVQLGSDITFNSGKASSWRKNTPEYLWYPIKNFAGTFDGQGHTVRGICLKENGYVDSYNGFFGRADQGSTIKNFSLVNSYFERMFEDPQRAAFMGSVAGETRGIIDSVYSDAILYSNGNQVGGIVGRMNYLDAYYEKVITVNNCWFDGEITGTKNQKMGGITSYVGKGSKIEYAGTKLVISHCLNTGTINNDRESNMDTFKGACYIGGIVGFDNASLNLTITDCLNAGTLNLKYKGYAGSITGRISKTNSVYTITDTYTTNESLTYNSDLPLAIHDITGKMIGGPANLPAELLTGNNAYKYSTLNFAKYWSLVDGSTPVLKTFAKHANGKVKTTAGVPKKIDVSWYNTNKDTFVLDSVEDLYGFYVLSTFDSFSGKTVKLGADIVFNEGNAADWKENAPANEWYPIGVNRNKYRFEGTFDGQGHTISGLYLSDDSDITNYSGFFGVTGTGSVVKNLKITNSYFERLKPGKSAMMGSVAGETQGTIQNVYSDAILYSDGNQIGGIVGRMVYADKTAETTVLVDNCWFDGQIIGKGNQKMGGISSYLGRSGVGADKTKLAITNCLFTGTVGNDRTKKADGYGGAQYIGGILGYDISDVNITIDGCLSAGKIDTKYDGYVGSVVGVVNHKDSVYTIKNTYGTDECWNVSNVPKAIHDIVGTVIGGAANIPEAMITGIKAYQFTSLDFQNTWAVKADSTPELKWISGAGESVEGYKQLSDVSWYDQDKDTYVLEDAADLYGFREVATYTSFKGKTVKLGNDIVVNTETVDGTTTPTYDGWAPIGVRYMFAGTFDGQGHSISGLSIKITNDCYIYSGLFGRTNTGSMLKNFSLKNTYVERMVDTEDTQGSAMVGSIAGEIRGSMDSVYSNAIISTDGNQAGGLVGRVNYLDSTGKNPININNCWFDGKLLGTSSIKMGGIAGYLGKYEVETAKTLINITNCLNSGYITNTRTKKADELNAGQEIGGLIGFDNAGLNVNIIGCMNTGEIDLAYTAYTGSIIGRIKQKTSSFVLNNCYAVNECFMLSSGVTKVVDEVNGKLNNNTVTINEQLVTGFNAYRFTELDFNKYWAVVEDGTPVLQTFAAKVPSTSGYKKMVDRSWYQEDVEILTIDSVQELYGFAQISTYESFEGQTVKLGTNITINDGDAKGWGANAPTYPWQTIGNTRVQFAGTFDGDGHTISGIYAKDSKSAEGPTGLFGDVAIGASIKNFMLRNSYFKCEDTGRTGSVVGILRGRIENVYSDAYIGTTANRIGGIVGIVYSYKNSSYDEDKIPGTIKGCWFNGTIESEAPGNNVADTGGIVGAIFKNGNSSKVYIEDCLYTGEITSKTNAYHIGGILGRDNAITNVTIQLTSCLSAGTIDAKDSLAYGSVIGFARKAIYKVTDTYSASSCEYTMGNAYTSPTSGDAITTSGLSSGSIVSLEKEDISGYNTFFETDFLDGEDVAWIARKTDIPVLAYFVGTKDEVESGVKVVSNEDVATLDTTWENDTIYTLDEWYGFASLAKQGEDFTNRTIKLGADITLNEGTPFGADGIEGTDDDWSVKAPVNKWYPIGSSATDSDYAGAFAGNFDGQEHTISGLYVKNTTGENNTGMFRNLKKGCTIKNFKLVDSYIESTGSRVGSVAGDIRGNVEGVYSNAIVKTHAQAGGGIVGAALFVSNASANITINNCWFDGHLIGADNVSRRLGGIVGISGTSKPGNKTLEIKNCLVTGTITRKGTVSSTNYLNIGGFIADNNGGSPNLKITNSLCLATLEHDDQVCVGAMIGFWNNGTITLTNAWAGKNVHDVLISEKPDVASKEPSSDSSSYGFVDETEISGYNIFFETNLLNEDGAYKDVFVARKYDVPALKKFASTDTETNIVAKDDIAKIDTSFATGDTYTIDSLDKFYGFAYLAYTDANKGAVYNGKTIKLGADIVVNKGTPYGEDGLEGTLDDWSVVAPVNKWYPIGSSATNTAYAGAFAGNFDGQEHTISGLYIKNTTGEINTGMFRNLKKGCTIKDFKLVDSYIESTGSRVGSVAGDIRGDVEGVYSNAIVKTHAQAGGGIVGAALFVSDSSANMTINNCWFDGHLIGEEDVSRRLGGIVGISGTSNPGNKTLEIKNCLVTGTITRKGTVSSTNYLNIGGFIADNNGGSPNLKITNSLCAATFEKEDTVCVGAMIGFWNTGTITLTNAWVVQDVCDVLISEKPDVASKTPSSSSGAYGFVDETTISGPISDDAIANLFGANSVWMADTITNKTPILKYFEAFWREKNTTQQ